MPAQSACFSTILKSKGFETRDLVKAVMRMEGGAIIHFETSWILARNWRNPVNDLRVSVQCEKAWLLRWMK